MRRLALLLLLGMGCTPHVFAEATRPIPVEATSPNLGVLDEGSGQLGAGCASDGNCGDDEICDAGSCVFSGNAARRVEIRDNKIVTDELNTEGYDHTPDSDFVAVTDEPMSTFSVDVDTASYSNVRRFLREGTMPPPDAVRIEELVNYFDYAYPAPSGPDPFSVTTEAGPCPWNGDHELVHIGLRGKTLPPGETPPRNLVFLLDVSGSMDAPNKLPLLKKAMSLLVRQLNHKDTIAIVVYAGASGLVLPATRGDEQRRIHEALEMLGAGGVTNGGEGIELAYATAEANFSKDGINRVILATDGDFNVGVTSRGGLERMIEDKRKTGVSLSVLGFGQGNLKDSAMEQLADKGNGNYAYIDSLLEARKVLIEQAGGTLITIAKDVKLQVEFNVAKVAGYRLIGYQNRRLETRDFTDDKKDAGEIGAGHTVTALYEIRRVGPGDTTKSTKLRYQGARQPTAAAASSELMNLAVRFKPPKGSTSRELRYAVTDARPSLANTSDAFRFSAAVAGFGMLLRGSPHAKQIDYTAVLDLARDARAADPAGHRGEFVGLASLARDLQSP